MLFLMCADRNDAAKAKQWKATALSSMIKFQMLPQDGNVFENALQPWESKSVDHLGVKRSTTQRVYEVVNFRAEQEKVTKEHLTPTALHQLFIAGVKFAETSENSRSVGSIEQ